MRLRTPLLIAAATLFVSAQLFAASFSASNRIVRELPIDGGGSVWIDNPFGNIDVIGGEGNVVSLTIDRQISASDATSMKEAADAVVVTYEGDAKYRLVRTLMPAPRGARWSAMVNYVVRVPRGIAVKVSSKSAEHIRIAHISGSVTVNGFTGTLIMDSVTGPSVTKMVNGRIIYDYTSRPTAKAQIEAVNADIDIYVPPDAAFDWVADTINGDILTTMRVRNGRFSGTVFRGAVNGTGGPTLNTVTAMGRVLLLARGTNPTQAQSVRHGSVAGERSPTRDVPHLVQKVQLPYVNGSWAFQATVADVSVGEVRGNAHVENGAGEVEIGAVFGQCVITTKGGPLNLGDIFGPLSAHTGGGDILVRAARVGGQVATDGGLIRVIYAGGPMTLRSGGGDIIVRQTSAALDAATTSGDITVTADPNQRTLKIGARTQQGTVVVNVSPRFAADIDATILTSNPDVNEMHIDFNGISVRREQVGSKTRIHATGKINGGGERLELYAEEGDIHISAQAISPIILANPRQ
jgi:DUF4097 and DUF4098 domain-containing protein YvlB